MGHKTDPKAVQDGLGQVPAGGSGQVEAGRARSASQPPAQKPTAKSSPAVPPIPPAASAKKPPPAAAPCPRHARRSGSRRSWQYPARSGHCREKDRYRNQRPRPIHGREQKGEPPKFSLIASPLGIIVRRDYLALRG